MTFKKAKEEGMRIAVHWQDADSSSANTVAELFPDADIMWWSCWTSSLKTIGKELEELIPKQISSGKYCELSLFTA